MRKRSFLSVCIPAHNEEAGISRTLESVLDALIHAEAGGKEILLCTNACTDKTVARVRLWAVDKGLAFRVHSLDDGGAPAKADGFVTVFDTKKGGKPSAWNVLKARSNGDILIFVDADVVVGRNSFRLLAGALEENPSLFAAGALVLAPEGGGALFRRMAIKMKEFAAKPAPYINGPLYAIRREAVDLIPEGLIGEDAYLSMAVGPEKTVKVPGAVALQVPPNTYGDYLKRRIRDNLSDMQLKSMYGERYKDFRRITRDTRSRRQRDSGLTTGERAFKRLSFPQTWLLKLIDKVAEKRARDMFRQGNVRWFTIASTKGRDA